LLAGGVCTLHALGISSARVLLMVMPPTESPLSALHVGFSGQITHAIHLETH
jgi:hypothetical protein